MSAGPHDGVETMNKQGGDLALLFIEAVTGSIGEMSHSEPVLREAQHAKFDTSLGDVRAIVGRVPDSPNCLVLSLPMKTARGMAARVLAEVREPIDEPMILDCIGELANVLAGQAKSLLANSPYHFSVSLPKVMLAPDSQLLGHLDRNCLRMIFDSEVGEFTLQVIAEAEAT